MKRVLLITIVLLFATSIVWAVNPNKINLDIDKSGYVVTSYTIILEDGSDVSIILPDGSESVQVYYAGGSLRNTKTPVPEGILLDIDISPIRFFPTEITVAYGTKLYTTKSGGIWELFYSSRSSAFKTIVKATFPQNSTIISWNPRFRFSLGPDTLFVYPDTDEFNLTVLYEYSDMPVNQLENKTITTNGTNDLPSWIAIILAIIVVLLVIIIAMVWRRKTPQVQEKPVQEKPEPEASQEAGPIREQETADEGRKIKDSVYMMLDDKEREALKVMEEYAMETTQAYVYKTTGIPKATLSDIIRRLERRNIVEKRREGRVNWIRLKDWIFEK